MIIRPLLLSDLTSFSEKKEKEKLLFKIKEWQSSPYQFSIQSNFKFPTIRPLSDIELENFSYKLAESINEYQFSPTSAVLKKRSSSGRWFARIGSNSFLDKTGGSSYSLNFRNVKLNEVLGKGGSFSSVYRFFFSEKGSI